MKLIIISGLSGAGKTVALHTLEDMGVFTVDNLPIPLLPQFADLVSAEGVIPVAAVAVDVRNSSYFAMWPQVHETLSKAGHKVNTLFLKADTACLLKRFSTTRRPHPLRGNNLEATISAEREQLAMMRRRSDSVIDTTDYTVHELRAALINYFDTLQKPPLRVEVYSFGFKRGMPQRADLLLDVRFLPNPYFVEGLSKLPGFDPRIIAFLEAYPETKEFIDKIVDLLHYLLPKYRDEGKSYISCAIGCTGGQHRSVYIAEELTKRLNELGHGVSVRHRDVRLPEKHEMEQGA